MMIKNMTEEERRLVLDALRRHDGHTICPDRPWEEQCIVSRALDKIRSELISDSGAEKE
jgi:hypothetical protein